MSDLPVTRVPMSRIYLFALVELVTLGALATPLVVSLSLKVLQIVPEAEKEAALGTVTALGAVTALVMNPVFGALSDRTSGRFGRRRPWLVAGAAGGLLGAVILTVADGVPVLIVGWVISQAAYNATLAALSALLADQVPEEQRAKASGIFGAFGFLGFVPAMAIASLFAAQLPVLLLGMPVVAVIVIAIVCVVLPDPPATAETATGGDRFAAFALAPFRNRRFALVWLQRFTMQLGYTIISTFGLFYLMLRLDMDQVSAASTTSVATLASAFANVAAAYACGYLASRRGNYTVFIVGSALVLAASLLMKAFTGDLTVFWIATVLGAYYAVDLALVMRTLPAGGEGAHLGLFNVAKTLPQSLAPALAPLAVLIGGADPIAGGDKNYLSLYVAGTVAVLLSLATLPGLRSVLRRPADAREQSAAQQRHADPASA